jgi:hypothetical protein
VRGSKVLYSCAADTRWRYSSYVDDVDDVAETLNGFGFSALFVERENATAASEIGLLRHFLFHTSAYKRLATQILTAGGRWQACTSRTVDLFVPSEPIERKVRFLEIPMPVASLSIRVDLDEMMKELNAAVKEG